MVKLVKNDGILEYKPGDHIGVIPCNRAELVDAILEGVNIENKNMFDQYFSVEKFAKNSSIRKKLTLLPLIFTKYNYKIKTLGEPK